MKKLLNQILQKGYDEHCYSCASAVVGCGSQVFEKASIGYTLIPDGKPATLETRYDMASCTKIMSTTMLILRALEEGNITLDDTIGDYFPAPDHTKNITIRQLLTHTSGIMPPHRMDTVLDDPKDMLPAILNLPLAGIAGVPRYSCFGFITLGKILETIYNAPLDKLASDKVFRPLGLRNTCYCPKGGDFAATEVDPITGIAWQGIVHDENARFMNGVSGNAGVFSDIHDCTIFAQMLATLGGDFLTHATMQKAIHNYTPNQEMYRGLGFVLAGTPGNYMGDIMPECSFGHSGFTGTSYAVDPQSGFFTVLLTNRVYPTRENTRFFKFRREYHNSLYAAFIRKKLY